MKCSLIPYQVGESGLVGPGNVIEPKGLWFKPFLALEPAFRSNFFYEAAGDLWNETRIETRNLT